MLSAQPLPRPFPHLDGAGDQARAIVSTLVYYDLFGFPPTASELERYAHPSGSDGHFREHNLTRESPWWSSHDGYWFLKGREHLVALRKRMMEASGRKLKKARRLARILQMLPGIRFIGVTGSLSMGSSLGEDDIDLLIITAPGRLWSTRALVLASLLAMGVKRADDGRSDHPDQVCANIFLQEDDLAIPDHNLFIAHEICQMLPLLGPETYERFIKSNVWIWEYLPQWQPLPTKWEDHGLLRRFRRAGEFAAGGDFQRRLEQAAMHKQVTRIKSKHARGHNVGVKMSPTQLRFHPRDLSDFVISAYTSHWEAIQTAHPHSDQIEFALGEALQRLEA